MKEFVMSKNSPIVSTPKGKLRGFRFDGVDHFYGIRYAKAKRFQMPEPVPAWEGVKDAGSYGMNCPVLSEPMPTGEVLIPHRFWPSSEHCQYLNLWTKSCEPSAKRPVLFWIHGGGYASGSGMEQICYDGFNLAKDDDVVVVTVNHRLNAFGYLDLSAFGEKYWNSVNVGMADLVEALRWVRDNIACFGGDPDNVTIFGHNWYNIYSPPRTLANAQSNDVMLGLLPSYEYLEFAQQNPFIYYSTLDKDMVWQVFAVYYTDVSNEFPYIEPTPTREEFQAVLAEAQAKSLHNFNVNVTTEDKVLTLSTCSRVKGNTDNQRFVVMAKLVEEGTPSTEITSHTNVMQYNARLEK